MEHRDPPDREHLARDEGISYRVLMGTDLGLRFGRRILSHLPSGPRCKLCGSPFHGVVGPLMRLIGKKPWPGNPKYCSACFREMAQHRAGAEIECSLLFADVRGSTTMAEQMRPAQFRGLMDRFFATASDVLFDHEAIVDKFVGDEVIGIFIPALAGELHARRAIEAGRALLSATGNGTDEPWLPVGGGVNSGLAFVGTVGEGDHVEVTAMGDVVNVTARLASVAKKGELLVTVAAAEAAQLPDVGLERRQLTLRGRASRRRCLFSAPFSAPRQRMRVARDDRLCAVMGHGGVGGDKVIAGSPEFERPRAYADPQNKRHPDRAIVDRQPFDRANRPKSALEVSGRRLQEPARRLIDGRAHSQTVRLPARAQRLGSVDRGPVPSQERPPCDRSVERPHPHTVATSVSIHRDIPGGSTERSSRIRLDYGDQLPPTSESRPGHGRGRPHAPHAKSGDSSPTRQPPRSTWRCAAAARSSASGKP